MIQASATPVGASPAELLGIRPFTPTHAARCGIGRAALDRLVRSGEVLRLVRGAYLVGTGSPVPPAYRVEAVALVLGGRQRIAGRTAAWLHGVAPEALGGDDPVPLDVGAVAPVGSGDEVRMGRLRVLTPLATAMDIALRLPMADAVPVLDGLLATGACSHQDLLAAFRTAPTEADRLVEIGARCDGRARDAAETRLRLHWLDARMPTPLPGLRIGGTRLALALPTQRFGAVVRGPDGSADVDRLDRLESAGWRVLRLPAQRILGTEPAYVRLHLEREFHQHLLAQVG